MDLVVIICVVFMVTFGEAVKILVADNGITGLSQTWQTQGSCDASWRWENGAWVSCHSADTSYKQNCYLDSTAWPTEMANMIYLNITVAVTSCNVAPQLPKCKESIEVYVRKKLAGSGNEIKSQISTVPFHVAPISNDSNSFLNADTIAIQGLNGVSDVYLQFQAAYTCIKVKEVLLFYYDCPAVTNELLSFPQERAPNKTVGTVKIEGVCVQNAAPVSGSSDDNILLCRYDGTYSVSGSCHCMKGHTKSSSKCEVCADHKYKNTTGNHPCSNCGTNTEKGPQPRAFCLCLKGYFRAYANRRDDAADCYRPPDEPVNVIVTDIKSDSVHISWKEPKVPESNPLGIYVIECTNCPKQHSVFPIKTKKLELNITGLGAFANYSLTVANENNITNLTREKNYAAVEFQTRLGKPGVILHFKYVTNNDGSVTLTWSPPFVRGGPDLVYVIEYGGNTETTSERSFTIKTGTQDKTYSVKIYAQVTFQGKTIRGDPYVESIRVKGGISLTVAIGASVGVIIFVVIVLVLVFCYWRRTHPSYLQVVRMEDGRVKLPGRMFPGGKLYVDPTTYNDVDDAVQEFAYELDRKDVKMGELLGGGEFAEVYKGSLFRNGKSCDVAVKTLKAGASKRDRDDFLGEAAILGQFADPNVVGLEGVILKERPNIIVLEFMKNGALDKYLQVNDMQFTVLQLLGMARGVASGMKYLSELGFIHRDLAARNILVDEHKVCKVSDFGMSREIKVDETYDTQGGKIPVRWTAPEAIQFKKFTTSSDVWSYGVLLWEIMSYGERPYWDWGNYEVLERLNAGYRLPPPMSCPKVIHDFMLHCWNRDRTKRPKFGESRDQLEKWIRNPDLLQEIASVITKTDENLDYTVLQTIHKWLEAIGMSRYTNNFIEQGFATPRQILDLTLEDLEALGIAPIGHRKKVYKAIQNTKIQVEARHNSAAGRRKTASVSKK